MTHSTYKINNSLMTGHIDSIKTQRGDFEIQFTFDESNINYQEYLEDLKIHGLSIVTCTDCGDGLPNDSMWQYLDNAEQLVINKYGSDSSLQDKLTTLREDRYVRAMKAKFPYESKVEAYKIIDATSQEIKDKNRHLPMRR